MAFFGPNKTTVLWVWKSTAFLGHFLGFGFPLQNLFIPELPIYSHSRLGVFMDKHETVVESIEKLLSLGVPDQEISDNLFDVGIERADALSLIQEAKDRRNKKREVESGVVSEVGNNAAGNSSVLIKTSSTNVPVHSKKVIPQISMDEEIVSQLPLQKSVSSITQKVSIPSQKKADEDIAKRIMDDVATETEDTSAEENVSSGTIVKQVTESDLGEEENEDELVDEESDNEKNVSAKTTPAVEILQTQKNVSHNKSPASQKPVTQKPVQQPLQQKPVPQPVFEPKKKLAPVPQMDFPSAKDSYQKFGGETGSSMDFEELWKKGIVVAVNAKLSEMKHLKDDVDAIVQQRVDEAVRKELFQFKVLLDSQKGLMVSSNKEALEQKQKEIVFIIDSKIAELKQYNKQLSDNLTAIENAKNQQALALSQVNMALEEAKKTKSQMIVEMNSEMIKTKSQAQAFLDSATNHLNQMDERINKTLELEKNIAEGMLEQAEQKIEQLAISRADELIGNMEVELNRLQSISKNISPEMLDQKITVLEEFKKQFLTSMQQNLSQINSAIDELNQKNIIAERTLQEKSLAIDAKLEELTKFEKQFTEKILKKTK